MDMESADGGKNIDENLRETEAVSVNVNKTIDTQKSSAVSDGNLSKFNSEEENIEQMDSEQEASSQMKETKDTNDEKSGTKEDCKVDSTNETPKKKSPDTDVQGSQDANDSHTDKPSESHLSPEEKDRYAFISEQLDILNSSNTGTPVNKKANSGKNKKGGPGKGLMGKLWSPLKRSITKGIKRSHRKSPIKTAKKLKLQPNDDLEKSESPMKQSDFESHSADESSSDDEKWRIFEESEEEIDRTLEDKADSFNLSALNVKSILHKIITDEHVLKMVQNTVESSDDENDGDGEGKDSGSLIFEPKMTRSKVKDFLEKQGSVPHPWGLSPVKHDSPSFLDIDLPEDEEPEDEDFDPDKVPLVESDEDSESVMSSNISDFGSPMPSTPRTPCVTPSLSQRLTDTEDSQSLLSPMGPPSQVPKSSSKALLGRKYQDAVQAEEARRTQEEEELIALRTRSKCPLTDTTILELEANFFAPDITADMYETECDDTDWDTFLKSLHKVDSTPEDPVKDAEEDDPEYDYLEEADQEYDKEEFRDDRAVKVAKKELHMLMDELYEGYGDMDPIDMDCKSAIKAQSKQIVQSSIKKEKVQSSVSRLTDYERKQIADQMRKHVQLLTQMYVLCQGLEPEHAAAGAASKMLLNELQTFAKRQETVFPDKSTMLRACTLDQACSVVNDTDLFKEKGSPDCNEEKKKKPLFKFENLTLPPMSYSQMEVLWTSPVFMYPSLLPYGGMFKSAELKKDRSRVKFLECEDNLLALGLEQFKNFKNGKELIQQLLLPTKTKKQISIRIKNLSAKVAKDNPVKYFRTNKQLPPFPHFVSEFDLSKMKAVRDQSVAVDSLPSWCKIFLSPSKDSELCCSNADCIKRRSGSLSSITGQSQRGSTPSTPVGASTENSQTGSSGSSGKSSDTGIIKRPGKRRLYNQKKSPVRQKGSFVPIKTTTLSGAEISEARISPITVYVVDKVPVSSSGVTLTQTSSLATTLASSAVVTCVTPTIFLVNSSITQPGKCTTVTTSTTQGKVISTPIIMSQSTPNLNIQTTSIEKPAANKLQSKSTPDLQQISMTTGNEGINENSKAKENSDDGRQSTPDPEFKATHEAKADLITGTEVASAVSTETQSESGMQLESVTSDVQTNCDTQSAKSESGLDRRSEGTSDLLSRPDSDLTRSETPTNENNITVVQGPCTPVLLYSGPGGEGTPNSAPQSNTGTPASKSAIEIMASFAPYFISPSLLGSDAKCKCGSERKYRPVIPKLSMSTNGTTKVSPFLDKREKLKASPRKKQLQQQARSILPKGFVISSFTSPSKKAASSLIDKAKGMKSPRGRSKRLFSPQKAGAGFRRILPKSVGLSRSLEDMSRRNSDADGREMDDDADSHKDTASEYDTQESEFLSDDMLESYDNDDDFEAVEDNENVNQNALDKSADTESEDTQSEDGNETQDDGDSQEENMDVDDDEHLATLMEASTTLRFKPAKETGGLSSLKAKRHRHKDVTLAMLAPDIIESDPYRDERDTAFAQAYLLKVKKVLRDDLDRYEKFLRIMYEFNKSGQSPVKLYSELVELFKEFPDLIHDFAGFLLPEQAVECDCFLSHQEFVKARGFLRKLEIYFSKTPSQFQKIMKAFSHWYKKPSRKLEDLRSQVEPMLRGQRYLLEEFSLFFPNDKPPESAADEFEEIDFDKSDDESKFDGFEEVELSDEREPQGTKRCQCQCHSTGDDTYRKRKKHCLSCCLTVIDGELVYRINSKTIKKINVTLGPPIKPLPVESKEKIDSAPNPAPTSEPNKAPEVNDLSDGEAAEKENIEHFDGSGQKAEAARVRVANKLRVVNKSKQSKAYQGLKDFYPWKKSTFLQRISNWSRKSKYSSKTPPHSSGSDSKLPSEQNSNESIKSEGKVHEEDARSVDGKTTLESPAKEHIDIPDKENESLKSVGGTGDGEACKKMDIKVTVSATHLKESAMTDQVEVPEAKEQSSSESVQEITERNATEANDCPTRRPAASSSDSIMANDILARAFSSAIFGEVSQDSSSVNFGTSQSSPHKLSSDASQSASVLGVQVPHPSSSSSHESAFGGGPEGKINFVVSTDSSFSKIKKSGSSGFLVGEASDNSSKDHESDEMSAVEKGSVSSKRNEPSDNNVSESSPKDIKETSVTSPFSPFSPFAQEIQNITSAKSPFACIKSPNVSSKKQTTPKFRRITPIRVKGSNLSEDDSSSAFQAVAQNSPLIEDSQLKSPFDKSNLERHSSSESLNKTPVSLVSPKITTFPSKIKETAGKPVLQGIIQQESVSDSQKSVEMNSSQKSSESLPTGSQNSGTSAESGSLKSDSSEQRTSPIIISHPVMHSEDANEGFIKPVVSDSVIVHQESLTENSLLGLVKGSNLGIDNLQTISNLTNILSALEHPASHSNAEFKESCDDNRSIGSENIKSDGSEITLRPSPGEYIPQSVTSIENMERLKNLDINVSRLSDSDESCSRLISVSDKQLMDDFDHTSISQEKITKTPTSMNCDSNNTNSGQLDFSTFSEKDDDSTKTSSKHYSGDQFTYLDDTTVVESVISDRSSLTETVEETKSEPVQTNSAKAELDSDTVSSNEVKKSILKIVEDRNTDDKKCAEQTRSSKRNDSLAKGPKKTSRLSKTNIKKGTQNVTKSNTSKSKSVTDPKVSSSVDTKSKESSNLSPKAMTKDNNRQENKKSSMSKKKFSTKSAKKEIAIGGKASASDSKHLKHKSKSKKSEKNNVEEVSKESLEVIASNSESCEIDNALSSENKWEQVRDATERARHDPVPGPSCSTTECVVQQEPSSSSIDDSSIEGGDDEMIWTKDMDQVILEGCKVHGPKDKTFAKIAKQIGKVTPKQVQKRFHCLLTLLLESGSEDDTEEAS